jgi:hypothetical protein
MLTLSTIETSHTLFDRDSCEAKVETTVNQGNCQATAAILHQRSICGDDSAEFCEYLADLSAAVATDNWGKLGDHFANERFIDNRGNLFVLAPYNRRINGQDITKLTLLEGKICSYSPVRMESAALEVFGTLNQAIPKLLVIEVQTSAGNIGNEEAFIAPGGWKL